jgi:hypothetical protein
MGLILGLAAVAAPAGAAPHIVMREHFIDPGSCHGAGYKHYGSVTEFNYPALLDPAEMDAGTYVSFAINGTPANLDGDGYETTVPLSRDPRYTVGDTTMRVGNGRAGVEMAWKDGDLRARVRSRDYAGYQMVDGHTAISTATVTLRIQTSAREIVLSDEIMLAGRYTWPYIHYPCFGWAGRLRMHLKGWSAE